MLVTIGGLVAWLPWHRQVQAIAEIERLGGSVVIHPAGPDWLRSIVGDEVMTGYDHVVYVDLFDTQVADAGLVHLRRLKRFEMLDLSMTQVTDAGLVHLKRLTKLETLNLTATLVTDAGLVHLKGLKKLQNLELWSTQVTDAGLVHLKGLTKLQTLILSDTQVTDAGVVDLQTALPKCEIQTHEDMPPTTAE